MSVTAKLSSDGKVLNVSIVGHFSFSEHDAFRRTYEGLDLKQIRVEIDLSAADYMDSSALGMLLVMRERAGGDRADIVLAGAREGISKILTISRFGQLFKIE